MQSGSFGDGMDDVRSIDILGQSRETRASAQEGATPMPASRPLRAILAATVAAGVIVLSTGPPAGAANVHANAHAVCSSAALGEVRCHAMVVTDAQGNPLATGGPSGYGPAQ